MEGGPQTRQSLLFVGSDLMARERIRSAAANLGIDVRFAPVEGVIDALRAEPPGVLIVDLDEGRERVLAAVTTGRSEGVVPANVVGFYSHVDRDLGAAAEEAGCTAVRRGRFWADLPRWLGS